MSVDTETRQHVNDCKGSLVSYLPLLKKANWLSPAKWASETSILENVPKTGSLEYLGRFT